MFCPICSSEYRVGFTECSECRVALVDRLDEQPPGQEGSLLPDPNLSDSKDDFELVPVFSSTNIMKIDIAESILRSAEIEFMTRGRRLQGLFGWGGFPKGDSLAMGPMEIQCRREDAADAVLMLEELATGSHTDVSEDETQDTEGDV